MKILASEKLSEKKYKTPEGYLICVDSVLARTGKQEYTRDELWQDSSNEIVEVDRKPEEVFSPQTLASFENKPITVEHPDVDVNSQNYKDYSVGFVRDVHQGKGPNGEDVILGTLVITDAQTIKEIEDGEHTDLSCGYDCDINDEQNPQQTNIRGNHVALCQQGRAGIARIMDSKLGDDSTFNKLIKKLVSRGIDEDLIYDIKYFDGYKDWVIIATEPEYVDKIIQVARRLGYDINTRYKDEVMIKVGKDPYFDSKMKDTFGTSKAYEMYLQRLERFKNDKEALEYDLQDLMKTKVLPKYEVEDLISKYKYRISKLQDSINDLYSKVEIIDSKARDENLLGKKVKIVKRYSNLDGTVGTIYSYEGVNDDDYVEIERNGHIYKVKYEDIQILDSKIKDYNPDWEKIKVRTDKNSNKEIGLLKNKKTGEFVVAWNYNYDDNSWGQGHYFRNENEALRYMKRNYKIDDSYVEDRNDTFEHKGYIAIDYGNTYGIYVKGEEGKGRKPLKTVPTPREAVRWIEETIKEQERKNSKPKLSTYRVDYVTQSDRSSHIEVKAFSPQEAYNIAKKKLGRNTYHILPNPSKVSDSMTSLDSKKAVKLINLYKTLTKDSNDKKNSLNNVGE